MALKIDLAAQEVGQKHWLHSSQRYADLIAKVRARNRERHIQRMRDHAKLKQAERRMNKMVQK